MVVLPLIKHSLCSLWSGQFFTNVIAAQRDTDYRFFNHPCFNWRKFVFLLACREIARTDRSALNDKTLIVDDTTNRSKLGYQMLQLGYHNGTRFYPVDFGFHTSANQTSDKLRDLDKRCGGWERRMESFEKKTDLLVAKLKRCWQILYYYSRRWAIECFFRNCKQLLELGKGQSETVDAVVAWASMVMIRYLLLISILAKRHIIGPIGPLFKELAHEHLHLALMRSLWDRFRKILMLSSRLFSASQDSEEFFYSLDVLENPFTTHS